MYVCMLTMFVTVSFNVYILLFRYIVKKKDGLQQKKHETDTATPSDPNATNTTNSVTNEPK